MGAVLTGDEPVEVDPSVTVVEALGSNWLVMVNVPLKAGPLVDPGLFAWPFQVDETVNDWPGSSVFNSRNCGSMPELETQAVVPFRATSNPSSIGPKVTWMS